MGLELPDGTPVDAGDLSRSFAAAMAAPEPDEPAAAAPPRTAGGTADPDAPYGRKADGSPRKSRPGPGRPRLARDARPAVKDAKAEPKDYTRQLSELTEALWFGLAQLPPTQAQAEVLWQHRPQLVQGWALAGSSNAMIGRGIDAITSHGTWVAVVAMATVPFALQSWALWTRPGALEQAGMPSRDTLASQTRTRMTGFIEEQNAQLAQAPQAA